MRLTTAQAMGIVGLGLLTGVGWHSYGYAVEPASYTMRMLVTYKGRSMAQIAAIENAIRLAADETNANDLQVTVTKELDMALAVPRPLARHMIPGSDDE